ncbi:SCO family protein [Streptomyces buecherae]|uniref:SCO family protein n=1 Tax=Streptomyces buecherae TaxID=2763006 RepID=A0A7H8NBG7_9ACTN|nr:SCO family protein [Streptomyces buecherae]MBC3984977.1 SCO family protein [Streptomyces buecherae]MBC3990110.1 SCO family protein [Streptomyces buecherae]QKW51088.1 SCO family protein [Streptomyces buecherae]QNJ41295.1 SCO family protein [Streptomyces buecherae]
MRSKSAGVALAAVTVLSLTLAACGGGDSDDKGVATVKSSPSVKDKGAIVLDTPKQKPDLVLTDTDGKKYDLIERTKGKPTLVYFGYTYCPDVCSMVMSNVALAKAKLPKADQDNLQVVFVTTDPDRDTPKRMRSWLDGQGGKDFTGLTGDIETIQAAAKPLGIFIEKPKKEKDGTVTVNHGAEVIGFSPKDDKGHWLYMTETTTTAYSRELPSIVKGQNP